MTVKTAPAISTTASLFPRYQSRQNSSSLSTGISCYNKTKHFIITTAADTTMQDSWQQKKLKLPKMREKILLLLQPILLVMEQKKSLKSRSLLRINLHRQRQPKFPNCSGILRREHSLELMMVKVRLKNPRMNLVVVKILLVKLLKLWLKWRKGILTRIKHLCFIFLLKINSLLKTKTLAVLPE